LAGGGPRIFGGLLVRLADTGFRGEGEMRGKAADDRAVAPFAREDDGVGEADDGRLGGGAVRDMGDGGGEGDGRRTFMLPSCLTMSLQSHSPTYAPLSALYDQHRPCLSSSSLPFTTHPTAHSRR